ncbi:sigma 54-interacting transcriptional regulator [Bradyrhizobium sp. TZ2]
MLESELYAHEEGSFTGALNSRKGLFELTHKRMLVSRRDRLDLAIIPRQSAPRAAGAGSSARANNQTVKSAYCH